MHAFDLKMELKRAFPNAHVSLPTQLFLDEVTESEIRDYIKRWRRGSLFRPAALPPKFGTWMCADRVRDLIQFIRKERYDTGTGTQVFSAAQSGHMYFGWRQPDGRIRLYDIEKDVFDPDGVEIFEVGML